MISPVSFDDLPIINYIQLDNTNLSGAVLEELLAFDTTLFLMLNNGFHHPVLDVLMRFITEKSTWYFPAGLLLIWLIWKGGREGRIVALLLILAVVLSDQLTSGLMKPFFERARPCKVLEGFRLLDHCGSLYGFPSSHAANSMAVTTLLALYWRRWSIIAIAVLIGYSRIYVGVHFPGDVLVGWATGAAIACVLMTIYNQKFRSAETGKSTI